MPNNRKLIIVAILLGLFTTLLAWGLTVEAAMRQDGGKKRVEEEEDDKPPQKKKRTEEEDDKPRKRIEEEEDQGTRSGISRLDEEAEKQPATQRVSSSDLAAAARETAHPRVKALFSVLAIPHDRIYQRGFGVTVEGGRNRGQLLWVEPLAEYVADLQEHKTPIKLQILDKDTGKPIRGDTLSPTHVSSIRWYEQVAVDEVKEFLKQNFMAYDPSNPLYLGRFDQLSAGEQALSAVLLHHRSARERGMRKGDGWEKVGNELNSALLDVQLAKAQHLGEAKSWDQAFLLMRRLVETYARPEDRKRIAGPLGDLLNKALKDGNFAQSRLKEARTQLGFIETQFPGSDVGKPIRDSLQAEAAALYKRAQELIAEDRKRDAVVLLKQAEEVWPELPGLRAARMRNDEEYQMLSVGMRELPQYVSPSWACTDAELRAVELLFESLVSLTSEGGDVLYYRPMLAEGRPQVIERGRQFQLPRQTRWSTGRDLRVDDLRTTITLLRDGKKPMGRSPAWGELLDGAGSGADPFQVKIRLRQGLLDPLGAMSFKVLPRFPDPTTKSFAEKPVGSGPFVFAGPGSDGVRFEANLHYGIRDGKRGLPRIREILFRASPDPVNELRANRIQMALDLTPDQAIALNSDPSYEVPMPSSRSVNRRIWFLAVNHRHPTLASADVRIALARAIPRESLLDQHFRKGLGRKVHKALNGPYPAGSWACDPNLVSRADKTSQDPFDPDYARARLKQGLSKLSRDSLTFTIKYPSGDKLLEEAMYDLCEEVKRVLPQVTLKAEPRPAHLLREEVEVTTNFELAYYHHDFVDETFWLYPLLGPHGRAGGENFLGYTGSLVGNVQAAMTLRNFKEVRKYAHAIHRQLLESDMPIIPMWQLDPLYAYDRRTMDFDGVADPLPWFREVERWRVRPR